MADAKLAEVRKFDLNTGGTTDFVEGSALAVASSAGAITVDGVPVDTYLAPTTALAVSMGPGFERTASATLDAVGENLEFDMRGLGHAVLEIDGPFDGQIDFQYLAPDGEWTAFDGWDASGTGQTTTSSGGYPEVYLFAAVHHRLRAYMGFHDSGAAAITWRGRANPLPFPVNPLGAEYQESAQDVIVTNGVLVLGNVPHSSVDAGNPIKIGGKGVASQPTPVDDGDRVNAWFDVQGAQAVSATDAWTATDNVPNTNIRTTRVPTGGIGGGPLAVAGYAYNGSSFDRLRGDATNGLDVDVTRINGIVTVDGTVPHDGIDSGNPIKLGGRASAAPPDAVSGGNRVNAYFSTRGALGVFLMASGSGSADPVTLSTVSNDIDTVGTITALAVGNFNLVYNGTNWDRQRGNTTGTFVHGSVAHDAAFAGNPLPLGAYASAATPSAVSADGDATRLWATTRGALNVRLVDAAGSAVTPGGGTQYVEDVAFGGNGTGTLMVARRDDALSTLTPVEDDAVGLRTNNRGALWVAVDGSLGATAGDVAHDAVDSGNPVKIGGRASSTAPSSVATGDRVQAWFTNTGAQLVTLPAGAISADAHADAPTGIVDATSTVRYLAVASGVFNGSTWDRQRGDTSGTFVVGNVAHDAVDSGNPVKIGGKASSTEPTPVTTGDRVDGWFTTRGAFVLGAKTIAATDAFSNNSIAYTEKLGGGEGILASANNVFNGTGWDRQRGDTGGAWVHGGVANDAVDAGNPVKIGGKAFSANPTNVAGGDRVDAWFDQSGKLGVFIGGGGGSTNRADVATPSSDGLGASSSLYTASHAHVFNGTTWDRMRGDTGGTFVHGDVAHDAVDSGNPVKIGGFGDNTTPSSVAAGDRVNAWFDRNGRLAVFNHPLTAATANDGASNGAMLQHFGPGGNTTAYMPVFGYQFNGTTWDRGRGNTSGAFVQGSVAHDGVFAGNPLPLGAYASAAIPTAVSADGDVTRLWAGTRGQLATMLVDASGNTVSVGGGTQYVEDVALGATPTGTLSMGYGSTAVPTAVSADGDATALWTTLNGALNTVIRNDAGGAITSQTLSSGAGGFSGALGLRTASALYAYNGSQFALVYQGDTAADAVITSESQASLNTRGFLYGFNGTQWDRVRVANTGRLQVDVVSGGGGGTQYAADVALGTATGTVSMGRASTAVPTDMSADGDAVPLWASRKGALVSTLVDANGLPIDTGQPLAVNIADSSGIVVVSGSVSAASSGLASHDLPVSGAPVLIGAYASAAIPSAVSADGDATRLWATTRGALHVSLVDTSGSPVTTGIQYAEDTALTATGTGTLVVARRDDALATLTPVEDDAVGLRVNSRGALWTVGDPLLTSVTTVAANTREALPAVGIGPGYTRRHSDTITSLNDTATIDAGGVGSVFVDITGTWTATLIFEYSTDGGTNWITSQSMLTITSALDTWVGTAGTTTTNGRFRHAYTAGMTNFRVRASAFTSGTATVIINGEATQAGIKVVDVGAAPHNFGYSELGVSAQYTTTQTSTTIGPTVSSSQRMVVTYVQIDWDGTTEGAIQVYFGTGAFSRGTSKTIFDGGGHPTSTARGGFTAAKPNGWIGAADEELKVTTSAAINPLTVTIWYYLITV